MNKFVKKFFGFIGCFLKYFIAQLFMLIVLFFATSLFYYLFSISSGKHFFNSYFLIIGILITFYVTFVLLKKDTKNKIIRTGIAILVLLLSIPITFTILANISFLFPISEKQLDNTNQPTNLIQQFEKEIKITKGSLPSGWETYSIEMFKNPPWAFVEQATGVIVKAYGPKQGYRDFLKASGETKRIYYLNEGRTIWMLGGRFNPNWSFLNYTFSTFRLIPIDLPYRIVDDDRIKIYARDGSIVLPENQHYQEKTPEEFIGANAVVMPRNGGSWPAWKKDLKGKFLNKQYNVK